MIVSHWGINNQSFINGGGSGTLGTGSSATAQGGKRPQLYIHDAWTEYAVKPGKLHLGAGIHYWNGVKPPQQPQHTHFYDAGRADLQLV